MTPGEWGSKMLISKHFTVEEFSCHDGTPYPSVWVDSSLQVLVDQLETIRAIWARPIRILSGYRTSLHNGAVGGAKYSQHMEGRAADIVVQGVDAPMVVKGILTLLQQGDIHLGGLGSYATFTHVDIRPSPKLVRWHGGRSPASMLA
jgi:uncharacterized protein YcbK (DUF882 family)